MTDPSVLAVDAAVKAVSAQRDLALHRDLPARIVRLDGVSKAAGMAARIVEPADRAYALATTAQAVLAAGNVDEAAGLARQAVEVCRGVWRAASSRMGEFGDDTVEYEIREATSECVRTLIVAAQTLLAAGCEAEVRTLFYRLDPFELDDDLDPEDLDDASPEMELDGDDYPLLSIFGQVIVERTELTGYLAAKTGDVTLLDYLEQTIARVRPHGQRINALAALARGFSAVDERRAERAYDAVIEYAVAHPGEPSADAHAAVALMSARPTAASSSNAGQWLRPRHRWGV